MSYKAPIIQKYPEYIAWRNMKMRCYVPTDNRYQNYGARGITVCDRWRNDFFTFISDVGRRPSKEHSLDRIDVNGNYEPSNVRWATRKEQAHNKRNSVYITAQGKTQNINEWAEETGIKGSTLWWRLRKGWDQEDVISVRTTTQQKAIPGIQQDICNFTREVN